ncbi:autophagy-related protein 13 homolog [Cydia fagiglandana]|uniref:autophagy-related protein 13 homolog n=1 Tax=Cydia fagiglandana TaxID=1458189 RepID=UPI002FEE3EBE
MAAANAESERARLYKFAKILTLKVAQIVVQSRDGKKITHECSNTKPLDNSALSTSPSNLQWFNLSIPDEPEVNYDTKRILNGEVVTALTNILCIEISLKTIDGDEMVLELWTVKLAPCIEAPLTSVSTIYYRMSVMLKSTLSISRITPAYKMSRAQNKETYKIYHKIYGGQPNLDLLGGNHKEIKVSELHTPIGTILIEVRYRTKMTILPEDRLKPADILNSNGGIMVKSDHFPTEPKRDNEKKGIDLNKPLTAGAFVDADKMRELHAMLHQQLPPEPVGWLLEPDTPLTADAFVDADKMRELHAMLHQQLPPEPVGWLLEPDTKLKLLADAQKLKERKKEAQERDSEAQCSTSKAIEVPRARDGERYNSLMDFPFADGSPITELANFYQECVHLRSCSDELGIAAEPADPADLGLQLRMFEEAVPEFDNMVASMFSDDGGEY